MRMFAGAGVMVSAALAVPMAAYGQGDQQQQGGYIQRVEPRPREHERVVFTSNVGYVPSTGLGYTDEGRVRLNANSQTTRVFVDYDPRHAIDVDGGLIFMLNRSWGVGGSYSAAMFDNFTAWTSAPSLGRGEIEAWGRRKEKTARLELTRVLLRRENRQSPFDENSGLPTGYIVRVFGGPAYQRIKQDVVITQPDEMDEVQGSGWGYHAGLDFSMYASMPGLTGGGIGFGTTARYTRGSVKLPGLVDSLNGDWPTGGWSFGGGIRFRY